MEKTTKFEGLSENDLEKTFVTKNKVMEVFENNSEKFFTQKMFVNGLKKSNPYINKKLRKLVSEKKITFRQVGKTKFYKLL